MSSHVSSPNLSLPDLLPPTPPTLQITELFVDNKSKLDQCSYELDEKNQRLEETHKNLQQTQAKLSQEEFISSNLASTQEQLYSTAGQVGIAWWRILKHLLDH